MEGFTVRKGRRQNSQQRTKMRAYVGRGDVVEKIFIEE